jgi:ribose transport system permease protein
MKSFATRPVFERNRAILLAYALVIVLAVFGELVAGGFLSTSHIDQLLIEASFIAFVALGQSFVIMSGGIDLSIPWVLNGAAVLLTIFANGSNGKTLWLFPVLLAGGAVVGLLNGIGVMFLRIPPIIMTLGMSSMVEGGLLLYTNGGSGSNAPTGVVYMATHRWGPVPVVAVVWLAVLVVATVVLSATPFGRRLYATGLNRRVAEFSGVNVRWVTVSVYVISGVAAALAGLVLAGYVGESYLGMGDPYLFASVAAVAIGGASVLGGTGNYVGTTAGALVLALLAAILPILGFSQATLEIVYGLVILVAVSLSSLRVAANRSVD